MQSNDDPPLLYINVGTEVSAKFKGAFCEAKISKVDKQVKCKVTYKRTSQSATLSDEFIRSKTGELLGPNEFKIGSIVSVIGQGGKNAEPQLATLNKIFDQSSYTVVFNDGDEKVVRRSFIRFKGERHYLNSETLDNAPLNNPEHFLQPIKNNSEFPNSPVPKFTASKLSPSLTDRTIDTKRTSNHTDDESFDDSLYEDVATTPNSSTKNQRSSTKQSEQKKSSQSKKTKKARSSPLSDDEDRLSKTADTNTEDPHESSSENSDSDSSSNDSDSSDDFPSEIKDRFVAQLYKFMDDRGTSMNRVPTIDGVDIDMHRIFIIVRRYGGYNKVCKLRAWADCYKRLQTVPNFPACSSSNVINLKSAYKRYLQPFEDFYRKLGSTMCDLVSRHTSSKSRLSDSQSTSRSLQLFKNRYINKSDTQKKGTTSSKTSKSKCSATTTSKVKSEPSDDLNKAVRSPSVNSEAGSKSATNKQVETDLETDMKTPASSENLTIESIISSPQASTKSLLEDQSQQPNEEVSLFSMMRKINDNYKMAKKEKEKAKTKEEPVTVREEPVKEETNKKSVKNSSIQTKGTKQPESKAVADIKAKEVAKKDARRSSVDKNAKALATVNAEKTTPMTGKAGNKSSKLDDEEEFSDSIKSKRKASRLSVSGSDDTEKSVKRKKTGSANKSISSNNETNDETDDDKDGPGSAMSRSASVDRSNEPDPEKDAKTGNIVFSDLDIDRVVDVKYSYGGKMHNYRAKILNTNKDDQKVLVHYLGWNSRYDEWIKVNRVLKLLSVDFSCSKRKKPATKANNSKDNSSTNKDLSIQPDIQPVSSPSQLISSPAQTPKSSPTVKANSQLKSLNKALAESYQRSLSYTSTCSSEHSKEEMSDVSMTEKNDVNPSTKSKTTNKSEEKSVPLAIKTRNSDSSSSVLSSPYSYRKRSNETKTDSDDQISADTKLIKSEMNTTTTAAKSDCDETTTGLTSLLSIKEELMETTELIPPVETKSEVDVNSFDQIDDAKKLNSPSKRPALSTSRKNSLNDSLNNSRRSLTGSRKNSVTEKETESPQKAEDPSKKQQTLGEIEVSFNDVEPSFTTANSTLVTFDIGNPRLSASSEAKLSEKEKLEKETWEKICSLNSSFNKSYESEKAKSETISDSEKKLMDNTSSSVLKDFVTLNDNKSQDYLVSVDKAKKSKSVPSESDQEVESKAKAIVNKENDNVKDGGSQRRSNDVKPKATVELTSKSIGLNKAGANETQDNVLAVSKTNENSLGTATTMTSSGKYSFGLNEVNLIGKQKIRYIEEQMKLCRESYAKLKNEVAAIDRKKKKLKRSYMDKSGNNSYAGVGNTTSNDETTSNLTKSK